MYGFDVGFEHAVVLEGLAVGQADGVVKGVAVGKLVYAQPLLGRNHAAGQAAAYHDVFQAFQFLLVSFGTDVAVVLFVHAVETDKLEVVAVEAACQAVVQVFGNRAAQVAALAFEPFVVGKRGIGEFGAGVGRGGHGIPWNFACSGCRHCNQAVWKKERMLVCKQRRVGYKKAV